MKKALILLSITVAAVWASAGSAVAADRGTFSLTDTSQTASWSGVLQASPPLLPEACFASPDACDVARVDVELPSGVWARPGGMLVATQPPPNFTNVNQFDLHVYGPDGRLVATANSAWSVGGHAVWVENPVNGTYRIVVAPGEDAGTFEGPARYNGFVSFDRGLTVKRHELRDGLPYTQKFVAFGLRSAPSPAIALLPDLVPLTPRNFHIETGVCFTFYACVPKPSGQPSCYPEETAGTTSHVPLTGPGPQRCLRFDGGEYNFGNGPYELHVYPDQGTTPTTPAVYQRVWNSDGSVAQYQVGQAVFHPSHGHFHYTGNGGRYRDVKLYTRLPNGEPGSVVAESPEKGICLLDVENGRFGQRPDSPQAFGNDDAGPCTIARQVDPNDPTFPNSPYIQFGISVGWADVYPWFILDQYIDITNVPDGKYVIVTKTDPNGLIRELSKANNEARACVQISGLTAQTCDPQPDLQVTSLSASNVRPREGEKVTITATVANNGDGDAAASSTEIALDGTRLPGGLLSTPALKAGNSATLSLNWHTRGVKGDHVIKATADSGDVVKESIETNNTRELAVTVRGNKVRNGSFEQSSSGSSPDDWSSSGSTAYESGGSDGARSVSTQPGGSWTSAAVPIQAGASYDASVATTGAGGTLLVQQLTADGSVLSSAPQPLLATSAFTPTSLHLDALAGAAQARIVLLGGATGKTTFDEVGLFNG